MWRCGLSTGLPLALHPGMTATLRSPTSQGCWRWCSHACLPPPPLHEAPAAARRPQRTWLLRWPPAQRSAASCASPDQPATTMPACRPGQRGCLQATSMHTRQSWPAPYLLPHSGAPLRQHSPSLSEMARASLPRCALQRRLPRVRQLRLPGEAHRRVCQLLLSTEDAAVVRSTSRA